MRVSWPWCAPLILLCLGCSESRERPASESDNNFDRQEEQLLDSLHNWGVAGSEFMCILSNKYFCSACAHPEIGPALAHAFQTAPINSYIVTSNVKLAEIVQPHIAEERFVFRNTRFLDTLDFPIYDWTIVKVKGDKVGFVIQTKSLNELSSILDTVNIQ